MSLIRRDDAQALTQEAAVVGVDTAMAAWEARDAAHAKWINALGHLTYLFGHLEWSTHAVLQTYSRDGIAVAARDMLLKPRVALARNVIGARLAAPEHADLSARWEKYFDRVLAASDKRNGIVHNPVMMSIFIYQDGRSELQHGLQRMRKAEDAPRMPLAELEAFNETLDEIAKLMVPLFGDTALVLGLPGDWPHKLEE